MYTPLTPLITPHFNLLHVRLNTIHNNCMELSVYVTANESRHTGTHMLWDWVRISVHPKLHVCVCVCVCTLGRVKGRSTKPVWNAMNRYVLVATTNQEHMDSCRNTDDNVHVQCLFMSSRLFLYIILNTVPGRSAHYLYVWLTNWQTDAQQTNESIGQPRLHPHSVG